MQRLFGKTMRKREESRKEEAESVSVKKLKREREKVTERKCFFDYSTFITKSADIPHYK